MHHLDEGQRVGGSATAGADTLDQRENVLVPQAKEPPPPPAPAPASAFPIQPQLPQGASGGASKAKGSQGWVFTLLASAERSAYLLK